MMERNGRFRSRVQSTSSEAKRSAASVISRPAIVHERVANSTDIDMPVFSAVATNHIRTELDNCRAPAISANVALCDLNTR